MSSCLESYSSCIKQETSNEISFTEKFIHIMEKIQGENAITKDVVLELMQLFYQNNSLFNQLFETSFLLIFKTYANEGARFNKYESQQINEKYSQFLKLFLTEMINMELEVKKSKQEEQYFENFIDFYLIFFAEAITSSKSFIKEFSFNILVTSIKIIDEVLDVELLPQTQNQLINSCLYLLGLNFEDFKKMGVQLYAMLKKIKITSIECQELLFQIIECQSNFQLRNIVILQGISLKEQDKIDRFLNRLKDKNPLIIQLVIQKLMNEKVKFENMTYQQRIKILIDGLGSHHANVRQKSQQFLSLSLMRFLNCNQLKKQQLKQNQLQQSGLQKFLNLFNSDHLSPERKSQQWNDFLIKSISLEYVSLLFLHVAPELVKIEIKRLFRNVEDLSITLNQSALLFCLLKRISREQAKQVNGLIGDNKINIKKFINQADFVPCLKTIVTSIKNRLKNHTSIKETQKFGILLKTVHLLIEKFGVADCTGKQIVCLQLKRFIIEFDYGNRNNVQRSNLINEFYEQGYKQRLFEQQLRKLNILLSGKQSTKPFSLPVINHPLDLLSQAVQVMLSLSQKQRKDSLIQIKILINELLDSRQLTLQREINTKILINTCTEISKAQIGSQQTKPVQHLRVIKTQVEKRLIQNRNKVKNNTIKGFTILARVISFEEKNFTIINGSNYNNNNNNKSATIIKASQYIDQIKSYLYNNEDEQIASRKYQAINKSNYYQSYSYNYLPYVLIYYYCKQSEQNYNLFNKLFYYYALEQDETVLINNSMNLLTKLINLRLLAQLQIQYSSVKGREQQQSHQTDRRCSLQVFAQTLLSMLFNSNKYKQKEHQNNQNYLLLIQETLCQQIVLKILTSSVYYVKNIKFLTTVIIIALEQHLHSHRQTHRNNIFMKQLLLAFQQLSTQHSNQLYQAVLCVYQAFITLLCQYQQNLLEKSQINLLLNKITQLFGVLFKIINKFTNLNSHQSIQRLQKYFIRFLKMLNLFNKLLSNTQISNILTKLRLKNIFTHLFQHKNHYQKQQNPSNILHSQHINTQLLIFTKRKVQESLELLKNNQILELLKNNQIFQGKDKTKQQFLIFLSDIQQIDQKLQSEIQKRLQQKNNQYDQQSTDHSPNLNLQNHSSLKQKIDVNLIETYEETFNRNLKQKDQQIKKTIKYIEKDSIFQHFILIWKQNHPQIQNNRTNQESIEDKISDNQKIGQNQHQVIIQNPKSDLSLIFDRRGRRKDKISDKYMKLECYQVKASIKKNRYLLIPFQIVQKAQFSSKRLKSQQRRLKKQKYASQKSHNSIIYPKIQYFNV